MKLFQVCRTNRETQCARDYDIQTLLLVLLAHVVVLSDSLILYVLSVSVLYHSFHYGRDIFFLFFSSPLFVHINRSSSISTDLPKLAKANQSVDIIKSFFKKVMCHDDGTTELWSISSHGVQSDSWLSHWALQPSRNGVFMSAVSPNT